MRAQVWRKRDWGFEFIGEAEIESIDNGALTVKFKQKLPFEVLVGDGIEFVAA